jgi:tagatose 1,6-diphosphate aldolase GatY/KbaY
MALVTSREMLKKAQEGGYAVGAFNTENMEMVQAIVAAAEELRAPVMIQTTPGTIKYGGLEYYVANAKVAADLASVPVCIHLDHGDSFELAYKALNVGYTSVMIDGSKLPFEENIALTAKVVSYAGNIPVEGELGKLGGKEDTLESEGDSYTDPSEAAEFVERTGISSLAISIGTAHGIYKGEPKLDVERLSEIRKVVDIPLVLHGGSGLPVESVKECIRRGISKVNVATELRIAFSDAVKATLAEKPEIFDPKGFLTPAREAVKELVKHWILICGCDGKA